MKHQQILDKLAARFLVQALDESFARAMTWGITAKEFSLDLQNQIWQKILSRWDCVLQEEDKKEVSAAYKQKTILAMAVTAHKYGLNIDSILLFSARKTSSPFSLGNGFTLPMSTATPASTNAPS